MKYLQSINFSQLTLAKKTEIKSFCRATADLAIPQSPSGIKPARVREFNPGMYAKYKRLSDCAERTVVFKPFQSIILQS